MNSFQQLLFADTKTTRIPYVPDFLTKDEADALFAFCRTLPSQRQRNPRNPKLFMRRLSYPTWADNSLRKYHGGIPTDIADAPPEIRELAARLSEYAGKPVNYLSILGYENEKDHIIFHRHTEDWNSSDQTVWVINLGETRTLGVRKVGEKQIENLQPVHGSLYILPHEYNRTHEHAILDDKQPKGLRISINCKTIPRADRPGRTAA